jgi:hypothetical protein
VKFTDEEVDAALAALSEPDRFKGAEDRIAPIAPQLQRILGQALAEGGFFDDAHESQLKAALETTDAHERETRIRTMLAEETRIGMLIGVAVGWELRQELAKKETD